MEQGLSAGEKCTGCFSRVKEGLVPACAKACPTAITYGLRNEMIKEAERRLAKYPDRYIRKIYGKDEAGGTSILYLSRLPFDELGFKQVTQRALPEYTWQALRMVPGIFLTVGGGLTALSWFSQRKERLQQEQKEKQLEETPSESKEEQE